MPTEALAQRGAKRPFPTPYTDLSSNDRPMTRYTVYVPSDTYASESTHDLDRAWDLCLSLSEEYGYAQVRQDGMIIGDYTDGR